MSFYAVLTELKMRKNLEFKFNSRYLFKDWPLRWPLDHPVSVPRVKTHSESVILMFLEEGVSGRVTPSSPTWCQPELPVWELKYFLSTRNRGESRNDVLDTKVSAHRHMCMRVRKTNTHTHKSCYHCQVQKVNFLLIGDRTIKCTNRWAGGERGELEGSEEKGGREKRGERWRPVNVSVGEGVDRARKRRRI